MTILRDAKKTSFPVSQLPTRNQNYEQSVREILPLVSTWSNSIGKRIFDCACVLCFIPILIPILLIIAIAVRLTSSGPVFFLQERMGIHGRTFTIVKFRTLEHRDNKSHSAVTTTRNQRFTPIGPFLRRFKIDELPQLWNVLCGEMSLVGPRPKLPVHQLSLLVSRPGVTGAATLAFAREEFFLSRLPEDRLNGIYQEVILSAKQRLDQEYETHANLLSDLKLIVKTVSRNWDISVIENLLADCLEEDQTPAPSAARPDIPGEPDCGCQIAERNLDGPVGSHPVPSSGREQVVGSLVCP